MKIHGTAKGGALSTKDFGVAFGGGGVESPHCQSEANTGRGFSAARTRAAQKVDSSHVLAGKDITKVIFTAEKEGDFSSGTLYARIYNNSNSLVGTIGSVNGTSLTTYSTNPPLTAVPFEGATITMPSAGGYLSLDSPPKVIFAEWDGTEPNGFLSLYQSDAWNDETDESLQYCASYN